MTAPLPSRGAGAACALLLALFAFAPLASAQELENPLVRLLEEKPTPSIVGGALFEVGGRTPNLPDGTKLHVRLSLKTDLDAPPGPEVSFFMTVVTAERFQAIKRFPGKRLVPLIYTVQVELRLDEQRKAIGDLIRREFALPHNARVMLLKQDHEIGDEAVRLAFRLETIRALRDFAQKAKSCLASARGLLASPVSEAELADARRALAQKVRPLFTRPFDDYTAGFLGLHENTAVSTLRTTLSELSPALSLHAKGETDKGIARLDRADAQLDRLEQELESRVAGLQQSAKKISPPVTAASPAQPAASPPSPVASPLVAASPVAAPPAPAPSPALAPEKPDLAETAHQPPPPQREDPSSRSELEGSREELVIYALAGLFLVAFVAFVALRRRAG